MPNLNYQELLLFALGAGLAVLLLTGVLLKELRRRSILDRPNERSSHTIPTPRGGGLAVSTVAFLAWLLVAWRTESPEIAIAVGACLPLALVSWVDDLRSLGPKIRFAVQIFAVGTVLLFWTDGDLFFQGLLPPMLDSFVAAIGWLWFINLFNFMDGIDGISAGETFTISIGLILAAVLGVLTPIFAYCAGVTAAAAVGFYFWNRHPAQVFLGDVGAIPLGFLLGWLCLRSAAEGQWSAALILPMYYLFDASLTLARRLIRGERVWQAHREHYYQQAVRRGLSHRAVLRRISAANLALVICALAGIQLGHPWLAVGAAVVVCLVILGNLAGGPKQLLWPDI